MINEYDSAVAKQRIDGFADKISEQVIPAELYEKFEVCRGLRDINGNGVLAGLTYISQVTAKKVVDGVEIPIDGKLYYRGIDVEDLVRGFIREKRYGFEETVYLLLFGWLPTSEELAFFRDVIGHSRALPTGFTRDAIMNAPSRDIMNALARAVLTLYSYDESPNDTSVRNLLRQSISLIAEFPLLAAYAYNTYLHYEHDQSLIIHPSRPELSTAENLLHILRKDGSYSELEARVLDLALVLHAEHGGGNNSSFAVHVVASSGTDTYSAIAAALGSLKGPKHGGANNLVMSMLDEIKDSVKDWNDEDELSAYLLKILHKEAFDRSGLIYGVGHAIYSLSDPRALLFEEFVQRLAADKDKLPEYKLYSDIARIAPQIIAHERRMYKGVSANIDFYSGFVYEMLGLPREMFTPIFAVSRIAGWTAHLIEETVSGKRIIRPAYRSVAEKAQFIPLSDRG